LLRAKEDKVGPLGKGKGKEGYGKEGRGGSEGEGRLESHTILDPEAYSFSKSEVRVTLTAGYAC